MSRRLKTERSVLEIPELREPGLGEFPGPGQNPTWSYRKDDWRRIVRLQK